MIILFNRKLEDVKSRLNELKNLVQYYQASAEFIHGSPGGAAAEARRDAAQGGSRDRRTEDHEALLAGSPGAQLLPTISNYEDAQLMKNLRYTANYCV